MSPPALAEPSRAAWLPCELRPLWSPGLLPSKLPGLSYSCMSPTRLSLSLSQRELASSPKAVPPRLSSVSPQPETQAATLPFTPRGVTCPVC